MVEGWQRNNRGMCIIGAETGKYVIRKYPNQVRAKKMSSRLRKSTHDTHELLAICRNGQTKFLL